jgi:taurine dioxygenase
VIETRRLTPQLGAEIIGIDLESPLDDAEFDALYDALYDAFLQHQVLVFNEQYVSPAAQVALARRFGEVQTHVMNQYHADGYPELYLLSNLTPEGVPSGNHPDRGTLVWHTDGSWQRRTGLATFMFAMEIPGSGGETHFADMYSGYSGLPADVRARIEPLHVVHNLDFSRSRRHGEEPMTEAQRKAAPPATHPVVRIHPETHRKSLFLGDHAEHIVELPYEKGRALIEQLNTDSVACAAIYRHSWQPNQLVVWDNRCLLHRATEYDTANERRVIRRCTVLTPAES